MLIRSSGLCRKDKLARVPCPPIIVLVLELVLVLDFSLGSDCWRFVRSPSSNCEALLAGNGSKTEYEDEFEDEDDYARRYTRAVNYLIPQRCKGWSLRLHCIPKYLVEIRYASET